jgi:acid phosphatase type 7
MDRSGRAVTRNCAVASEGTEKLRSAVDNFETSALKPRWTISFAETLRAERFRRRSRYRAEAVILFRCASHVEKVSEHATSINAGVTMLLGLAASTCTLPLETLPPCDVSAELTNIAPLQALVHVVAVGDVADCNGGKQAQVAAVIGALRPDAVLGLGDLAYENGSLDDYLTCYAPSFGRFRSITRAVPGNHEYHTPHAGPYYAYFCGSSGTPLQGFYSFELGTWHVVALNSNCGGDLDVDPSVADDFGGCGTHSAQVAWLKADLDAHPHRCTLAMFHHPRWSSSSEGSSPDVSVLWKVLVEHHIDVVLNGHAHNYQRFAQLGAQGDIDTLHGARIFVVGTGGSPFSGFTADEGRVKSESRNNTAHGVLSLALSPISYSWGFVPIAGDVLQDEGRTECHLQ